jgi:hypothetical protein
MKIINRRDQMVEDPFTKALANDPKRLRKVVDRYADLERRIVEITEGRNRVARLLRAVAVMRQDPFIEGNANVLDVQTMTVSRKEP